MRFRLLFLLFFLFSAPSLFAQLCSSGYIRYYQDLDGDGFGNDNVSGCYSSQPVGYVIFKGDCDDNDPNIHPSTVWYEDQDGDGLGDPGSTVTQCLPPRGTIYVLNGDDQCPNEYADTVDGCPEASEPEPEPDPDPEPATSTLSNMNYVHSINFTKPFSTLPTNATTTDLIEEVTYLDGLGRPIQNIKINQSKHAGNLADLITEVEYDSYGRQIKEYLPYAKATSSAGDYQPKDLTQVRDFYWQHYEDDFDNQTGTNAFSEKSLEASPLSRILKQAAPGSDWKMGGGHEIEFDYQTNGTGTAVRVRHFEVNLTGGYSSPTLTTTGYYPAGALYKNVTRDENHTGTTKNHTTEEFTNKKGQVVLKRSFNNGIAHDTYYVYDDYGNLTYVLPPLTNSSAALPTTTELSELCYQYKYDSRNRLIEKKIPGKGWELIVYNKLDQPILKKDAALTGKWLYTKYDAFGRVISTGLHTHNASNQSVMQGVVDNYYLNNSSAKVWEEKPGTNLEYSNKSYPTTNNEVLTLNYYDNYYFDTTNKGLQLTPGVSVYGHQVSDEVKGLPTGSRVKVLDQASASWITTVNHYDAKGRLIYTGSYNELLGVKQTMKNQVEEMTDNILKSETYHQKGSAAAITIVDEYDYDDMTRLKKHTQSINGAPKEVIVLNTYDPLGQLVGKGIGNEDTGSRLQNISYSYNVRGWLKTINDIGNTNKLFNFKLSYDDPATGTPLYNGNISRAQWRTANTDSGLKHYNYSYDHLNRIISATAHSSNYNVSNISYDKNGNIQTLTRRGAINEAANNFGNMDVLTYTYNSSSNKLRAVNDSGEPNFGFKDNSTLTTQYTYDTNGNMLRDDNKGITSNIAYNHLNLPTSISLPGGSINNTYDATGVKIKKVVDGVATEYIGGFVYKRGTLEFIHHPEGYVTYDNGQFNYVYNYKDHLGNVRLSYRSNNGTPTIVEENNYYPFGLKHKGYNKDITSTNVAQNYKFNGKELNEELGLDWYDYGARNYQAELGRWVNIDPLAEKYETLSPYVYVANNPINAIDPDGRLIIYVNGLLFDQALGHKTTGFSSGKYVGNYAYPPPRNFFYNQEPRMFDQPVSYWGGTRTILNNHFRDNKNIFINGTDNFKSQASDRFAQGKSSGLELIAKLQNGTIELENEETIKVIGHSQGAAFAAGMLAVLADSEYASRVELGLYLSPHQPGDFAHPDGIFGAQFSTRSDRISSKGGLLGKFIQAFNGQSELAEIEGANFLIIRPHHNGGRGGHSVDTWNDILQRISDFLNEGDDD